MRDSDGALMVPADVFESFCAHRYMQVTPTLNRNPQPQPPTLYPHPPTPNLRPNPLPSTLTHPPPPYLQHALFREHPHLLRNLADANNDGGVSRTEFAQV